MSRGMNFVKIDRLKIHELPDAAYIEPAHVILYTVEELTAPEIITTAVCWTLECPMNLQVRKIHLTKDLHASVEAAQKSAYSDQILVFLGMAGLMVLGKEVRLSGNDANYKYLLKRWQALCAISKIKDTIFTPQTWNDGKYMDMMRALEEWQVWMKFRKALRNSMLDAALIKFPDTASPLRKAAIAQVKMVLNNCGLKSVLIMDEFVTSFANRAILISEVIMQAVELRKTIERLKQLYGEKFPFIKVYRLEFTHLLNHKRFPDLYYAALTTAVQNKQLGPKYILTNVETINFKNLIDREIKIKFDLQNYKDKTTKP